MRRPKYINKVCNVFLKKIATFVTKNTRADIFVIFNKKKMETAKVIIQKNKH